MSKYLMMLGLLLTLSLSTHTQATLVTLQSIKIDNTFDNLNDFKSYWQSNILSANQPEIYENDNFENIKTGGYNLNLLSINFELPFATIFSLFAGLDAHYGAEIYIDHPLVYANNDDLWWRKNWNNKDVVELENVPLSAGQKSIDIFWAESCCNGPNSVMFTFNNAQPVFLNSSALQDALLKVPAPNGITLFTLGLLLLIGLSANKKRKR